MRRSHKGILLIVLLVAVIVLAAIPAKSAKYTQLPGRKIFSTYGETCCCDDPPNPDCGCIIIDPEG